MNHHVLFYNAVNEERRQICEHHGKVIEMPDYRKQQDEETTRFCRAFWTVIGIGITGYCLFFAWVLYR